jgi:hypothetical protein
MMDHNQPFTTSADTVMIISMVMNVRALVLPIVVVTGVVYNKWMEPNKRVIVIMVVRIINIIVEPAIVAVPRVVKMGRAIKVMAIVTKVVRIINIMVAHVNTHAQQVVLGALVTLITGIVHVEMGGMEINVIYWIVKRNVKTKVTVIVHGMGLMMMNVIGVKLVGMEHIVNMNVPKDVKVMAHVGDMRESVTVDVRMGGVAVINAQPSCKIVRIIVIISRPKAAINALGNVNVRIIGQDPIALSLNSLKIVKRI